MSLRLPSLVLAIALALLAAPTLEAAAQPDQSAEKSEGDAELWGEPGDDPEAAGAPKATGSSYNYTHIAYAAGLIAVMGAFLIWLIKRQGRERA